jgi:hypothetical protein
MMGSSTKRIDAQLEAATARWGRAGCRTIETVADSSGSLDNTYFDLNVIGADFEEIQYYVYNGTDPSIAGKTGIVWINSTDDTAVEVAGKIKTAIENADILIEVSLVGSVLTLENRAQGAITVEADSGSTGFTFETLIEGLSVELGATSGALELTSSTEVVDITSNQTGSIIGSQIYVGSTVEISMSLIEVNKARYDVLVGEVTGDSVTPVGGTKVTGYGESRLFQSLDDLGGQLILHPIRLDVSDKSSDVVFWKSAPKPESLNFDGTAPQELAVTFTAYLDGAYNKAINLYTRGDWSQKGLRA